MRNIHLAEWILSLVTTRDRAASTVGDLAEQAAARGVFWFWLSVLRTAAPLLWRNVAEESGRLIGLAFLGLAVYIGIDMFFVLTGLDGTAFLSGQALHLDTHGWQLLETPPAVVSSLFIGRMLAHWAPRRELAACVVYMILVSIYILVPMLGDNGALSALLCILIVPVGAAWGRYRRLGAA